jgi:DNA repair exonuclease SbcCD ATPase subunit
MTALTLTQSEIADRLRIHSAVGGRFADKKAALRAAEQRVIDEKASLRAEEQRIADVETELRAKERGIADAEAELRAAEQKIAEARAKLRATQQEITEAKAEQRAEQQRIDDKKANLRTEEQRMADEKEKISTEEAEWLQQEIKLRALLHELNENGATTPVPLEFDTASRTIRWVGGSVKLGKKPYKFVKALYHAKKRRAVSHWLIQKVWGNELKHKSTVKSTVTRLNKRLEETNCPYKVNSATCFLPVIYMQDPATDRIIDSNDRPPVKGFRLAIRKQF